MLVYIPYMDPMGYSFHTVSIAEVCIRHSVWAEIPRPTKTLRPMEPICRLFSFLGICGTVGVPTKKRSAEKGENPKKEPKKELWFFRLIGRFEWENPGFRMVFLGCFDGLGNCHFARHRCCFSPWVSVLSILSHKDLSSLYNLIVRRLEFEPAQEMKAENDQSVMIYDINSRLIFECLKIHLWVSLFYSNM